MNVTLPQWRAIAIVAGLAIAVALPFIVEGFSVFQLTQVMCYAIAVLGLNLLTGYNGQFSLGHSAFYALGAYTTAIMIDRYEIAYYWTILPAGLICFIGGFLFGFARHFGLMGCIWPWPPLPLLSRPLNCFATNILRNLPEACRG